MKKKKTGHRKLEKTTEHREDQLLDIERPSGGGGLIGMGGMCIWWGICGAPGAPGGRGGTGIPPGGGGGRESFCG